MGEEQSSPSWFWLSSRPLLHLASSRAETELFSRPSVGVKGGCPCSFCLKLGRALCRRRPQMEGARAQDVLAFIL